MPASSNALPSPAAHSGGALIIETSANELYRVRDAGDPALAHCWIGIAVKRVRGGYEPKKGRREELVRKAASRVVVATA